MGRKFLYLKPAVGGYGDQRIGADDAADPNAPAVKVLNTLFSGVTNDGHFSWPHGESPEKYSVPKRPLLSKEAPTIPVCSVQSFSVGTK